MVLVAQMYYYLLSDSSNRGPTIFCCLPVQTFPYFLSNNCNIHNGQANWIWTYPDSLSIIPSRLASGRVGFKPLSCMDTERERERPCVLQFLRVFRIEINSQLTTRRQAGQFTSCCVPSSNGITPNTLASSPFLFTMDDFL